MTGKGGHGLLVEDDAHDSFRRGDDARVLRIARSQLESARSANEPDGQVAGLYAMARVALRTGDLVRAEDLANTALGIAVAAGNRRLEERPRHVLAAVARLSGDYVTARERYVASIELNEALGQREAVHGEYHNLTLTELHLGNVERARELFEACCDRVSREGYRHFVPYLGIAAAAMAAAEGDHANAARMIGFTDRAFSDVGQVPDPDDAAELDAVRVSATTGLGASRFASEYETGSTWNLARSLGVTWPT